MTKNCFNCAHAEYYPTRRRDPYFLCLVSGNEIDPGFLREMGENFACGLYAPIKPGDKSEKKLSSKRKD